MGSARPIVVKLGGSLGESGRIGAILQMLASVSRPCILVPGGGTFADAVRRAQAEIGFDDVTAHRMALLAMHQTGLMLAALGGARLQTQETLAGMRAELATGRIPVWLPYRLAARDATLPADWSTTSDALSARLAERLKAPVALVKSCHVPREASPEALAGRGIVDPVFPVVVARAQLAWQVLGTGDEARLVELLGNNREASIRPRARPPQTGPQA